MGNHKINPPQFHYSENPDITEFVPRPHVSRPHEPARVWAIDARHAPLYFFPRNCPRAAFWALPTTTHADSEAFLAHTDAQIVLTVEAAWLEAMQTTLLYEYEMPPDAFAPLNAPGSPEDHGVYVARKNRHTACGSARGKSACPTI